MNTNIKWENLLELDNPIIRSFRSKTVCLLGCSHWSVDQSGSFLLRHVVCGVAWWRLTTLDNMAKKQRGKASSSSKTADIEKPAESFTLSLESSDDEAPEEVTFEDSKAEALRSMKQALDTAKR